MQFLKDIADDERIPVQNRVVLGGLLLYLMTPIDLIPDFIPIVGWLDDAFVTLIILDYVFNSADSSRILQHYPWNKKNFEKMKTYVERLSWLIPPRVKNTLFREATRLSIAKREAEQLSH
jgi:uncharacterized membrane protein YkvA (DUF1232 family)